MALRNIRASYLDYPLAKRLIAKIIDAYKEEIKDLDKEVFYSSLITLLICFLFERNRKIRDDQQFLKKLLNLKIHHIKSEPLYTILKEENISPINIGHFFDLIHQSYLKGVLIKNFQKSQRAVQESFYTPFEISDMIVKHSLTHFKTLKNKKLKFNFLDPCCGTGIFISSFVKESQKLGLNKKDMLNSVHAFDIDKIALDIAMILFQYELGSRFSSLKKLKNFKNKDFVFQNFKNGLFQQSPDNKKFDLIVINPPYGRLKPDNSTEFEKTIIKEKISYLKSHNQFKNTLEGTVDLYRLFLIKSSYLLNKNGVLGCIVPMSFLADKSSNKTRNIFINEDFNTINKVFYFPEKARLFRGVNQGFTIFISKNGSNFPELEILEMSNKDNTRYSDKLVFEDIKKINHDYVRIPLITNKEISDLIRINAYPKISSIPFIKNLRGELDLTIDKDFLEGDDLVLIKGSSISPFKIKKKFNVLFEKFINSKSKSRKVKDIQKKRIVGQNISNSSLKRRLVFALVDKNHILANSTNYLTIENKNNPTNIDIYFLLGILNSDLMNWRFKIFSSNNHVNNYQIDEFPIPINANPGLIKKISCLSKKLSDTENNNQEFNNLFLELNKLTLECYSITTHYD